MCENHRHAKVETWITPESSRHLSSKMVQLYPGEGIPPHTTGPEREEVIVCIYGTIQVGMAGDDGPIYLDSGNACFIPENTLHWIANVNDAPAQYAFIVTKKKLQRIMRDRLLTDVEAEKYKADCAQEERGARYAV